jgi:hypothetical protein
LKDINHNGLEYFIEAKIYENGEEFYPNLTWSIELPLGVYEETDIELDSSQSDPKYNR